MPAIPSVRWRQKLINNASETGKLGLQLALKFL